MGGLWRGVNQQQLNSFFESGGGLLLGTVGKQPELTERSGFMLADKSFPLV